MGDSPRIFNAGEGLGRRRWSQWGLRGAPMARRKHFVPSDESETALPHLLKVA